MGHVVDEPARDEPALDEPTWLAIIDAIVADGPHDDRCFDEADATTVLTAAPGAALATALATTDPRTLPIVDAVEFLRATERAIAWLGARQTAALVAIAGPRQQRMERSIDASRQVTIEDACRSEVAAAARWSESWAHDRIATARLLDGPLSGTRAALESGELTLRHADVIAAAAQRLSGFGSWWQGDTNAQDGDDVDDFTRTCAALEAAAIQVARRGTVTATRRCAERALLRLDADAMARRRRVAQSLRDVTVSDDGDGMATVMARMGIAQAQACLTTIDRLAHDPRLPLSPDTSGSASIGERRVEALVHTILAAAQPGAAVSPGGAAPVRAHVDVTIGLDALLGLADTPGRFVARGRAAAPS